jgi:plastocyanin domain-containing protein
MSRSVARRSNCSWNRSPLAALCLAAGLLLTPERGAAETAPGRAVVPAAETAPRRIDIKVTDAGFEPRQITVKRGQPITLAFTRITNGTCITAIDIPEEGVKEFELPLNKTVTLTITPKKKGTERFHCSAMAMGKGRIIVED